MLPSIKANLSLAVRRLLTRAGAGCDTFGPGELHAALEAGVPPGLISVNGSIKSAAVIDRAVAAGARITLDSAAELEPVAAAAARHGTVARVRLRLRPDYDGLTQTSDFFPDADVRLAAHRYKPGIPHRAGDRRGRRGARLTARRADRADGPPRPAQRRPRGVAGHGDELRRADHPAERRLGRLATAGDRRRRRASPRRAIRPRRR